MAEGIALVSQQETSSLQYVEPASERRLIFEGGTCGRMPQEHRANAARRFGENWLLRQNPSLAEDRNGDRHARYSNSYRPPRRRHRNRPFRSLEGIELEIR